MDKITIEELAVFLPYGLEIHLKYKDAQELRGLDMYSLTLSGGLGVDSYGEYKPIVRSRKSLFKPFQHAGETVNAGELIIEEWNKLLVAGDEYTKNDLPQNGLYWESWQARIAAKYHFDIFGWLDKGLAIEKQ